MDSILSSRYQPPPTMWHSAVQVGEKSYIWGGITKDFFQGGKYMLESTVNVFDPYLETREEQHTIGVPPHGLYGAACTVNLHLLYSFAGFDGISRHNSLHVLDTNMLVWKDMSNPTNCPMPKSGCGMVFFGKHHLAIYRWTWSTHTTRTDRFIFHQES